MDIKRLEPNSQIWFTSDTHYNHANIVRGASKWEDKSMCRDFDTVEEMNTAICSRRISMHETGNVADSLWWAVMWEHSANIVRPVTLIGFNDKATTPHLSVLDRIESNCEDCTLSTVR